MNYVRGITFIEVMVTVAVATLVMVVSVQAITYFYKTNRYTIEQADAVSSAQRGVDQTVRVLRETNYSVVGAYPIVAISTTSVDIYADIDQDLYPEEVRFYLDGTDLKRSVTQPMGFPPSYASSTQVATNTLARSIRNLEQGMPVFDYYNASGTLMTDFSKLTDVRYIRISLIANISTTTLPNQLVVRSSATLRNLR
jgi:hypothetical protein